MYTPPRFAQCQYPLCPDHAAPIPPGRRLFCSDECAELHRLLRRQHARALRASMHPRIARCSRCRADWYPPVRGKVSPYCRSCRAAKARQDRGEGL